MSRLIANSRVETIPVSFNSINIYSQVSNVIIYPIIYIIMLSGTE